MKKSKIDIEIFSCMNLKDAARNEESEGSICWWKLRKWIEEEEKREAKLAKAFDQVREIITRQPHSYIINIFLFVCVLFGANQRIG